MSKIIKGFTIILLLICIYFSGSSKVYAHSENNNDLNKNGCIAENKESEDTDSEDGGVNVFSEGGEWLWGEGGINLNILRPSRLMKMEGTASIWSLLAYLSSILWWFVLVAFFFAVGIGAAKWISSQGQDAKLQTAQKWMKNAVTGFTATIVVFLIANFITWFIGIGGVFELSQNLAVCGEGNNKKVLYEWKRDNDMLDATDCTCRDSGWSCTK